MIKRRDFLQKLLAIMAGSSLGSIPLAARSDIERPLIMGIFPRRNSKTTYRMFSPMAAYLSGELGVEIRVSTEKNFKIFWENVQNRKYDLVHFNQYHYVLAHNSYGYNAILMNEEENKTTMSGSIVVRKDSGINSISDLKGKNIVFGGGPSAMQSYIIPRWLLQKGGLNNDQYTTTFARNPPNAILTVYNRQADAAGTGDAAMQMHSVKSRIDTQELKFLALSEPDAQLPWAVADHLGNETTELLKSKFLKMHSDPFGQMALKRAELTGLAPASDNDYDSARLIISEIYGNDFGASNLL